MPDHYKALTVYSLPPAATFLRPHQEMLKQVSPDHPALDVMTDLTQVSTLTVDPNVSMEDALQKMIHGGVRLLFVVSSTQAILGVITARDIEGERPIQFIHRTRVRHQEILVRDIMTPADELDVLRLEDVEKSRVGDIVATLKRVGRQHALVMEPSRVGGAKAVRGIFSLTQIGRQLGVVIEPHEVMSTFARIEAVLGS